MTRLSLVATLAIGTLAAPPFAGVPTNVSAAPVTVQQAHEEHHPDGQQPADVQKQEALMMQMQQKMMADMKGMDDRLTALVTKMNAATGESKTQAIADLVTAMVQQRTAMRDQMMQMQGQMMGHMMQHMGGGLSPEMKKMMSECPMMKMMKQGSGNR